MTRHHLNSLVNDGASEVAGTSLTVASCNDHAASTVKHIAPYIVDVRTFNAFRTTHYYIIGGIDAVAASAVGAQQVVPTITVEQVSSLTVDGNVLFHIALHALASRRIKLDEADGTEISAIASPKTTSGGVEQ